jgi:hypothetical protein
MLKIITPNGYNGISQGEIISFNEEEELRLLNDFKNWFEVVNKNSDDVDQQMDEENEVKIVDSINPQLYEDSEVEINEVKIAKELPKSVSTTSKKSSKKK